MGGDHEDLRRGTWTWFSSLEWQPCVHSTFPPLKSGQLDSHLTGCREACGEACGGSPEGGAEAGVRLPSAHQSFLWTSGNKKPQRRQAFGDYCHSEGRPLGSYKFIRVRSGPQGPSLLSAAPWVTYPKAIF